jgi:hypothetical protein
MANDINITNPRERMAVPVIRDYCPECGTGPLHASESDDLGRCAICAGKACHTCGNDKATHDAIRCRAIFVPTPANPAPRDRVLLVCGYDGIPGPWLPVWRVNRPGHGHTESCVGDGWAKFLAFWRLVGWVIADWDRAGRPGPVFSHLSAADQQWLLEGMR